MAHIMFVSERAYDVQLEMTSERALELESAQVYAKPVKGKVEIFV